MYYKLFTVSWKARLYTVTCAIIQSCVSLMSYDIHVHVIFKCMHVNDKKLR